MEHFAVLACICVSAFLFHGQTDALEAHKLTVGLYKSLAGSAKQDQNIAFSPFSVNAGLSMAYIGADGVTKSQLASALGIPEGAAIASLAQKFQDVNTMTNSYTLQSANGFFVEQTFPVLPEFVNQIVSQFEGSVTSADFLHAAEAERGKINTFASSKTSNKIQNLLPPGSVDAHTRMVLANAVYFKADWEMPFDLYKPRTFNLSSGVGKKLEFMHKRGKFAYVKADNLDSAEAVEVLYKRGEASMVVIMPKTESNIQALETNLTPAKLAAVFDKLAVKDNLQTVNLHLPRFRVSSGYNLNPALQSIGIKAAFSADAQFPGITKQSVRISQVQHKAFIDVAEKGTEASGDTDPELRMRSAGGASKLVYRADRPFLFFILHKASKQVLFAGRIADPTSN